MANGSHGSLERMPGALFRAMGTLVLQKKDCAREALGISRERVRQIEAAALEHLRMPAQVEMLREFLDGAAVPERTPRPCEAGRQSVPRTNRPRARITVAA